MDVHHRTNTATYRSMQSDEFVNGSLAAGNGRAGAYEPISIDVVDASNPYEPVIHTNGAVSYIEIPVDAAESNSARGGLPGPGKSHRVAPAGFMRPAAAGTPPAKPTHLDLVSTNPNPSRELRSPGPKVTVAPRKGSFENRASFRNMQIAQTPEEKKKVQAKRSGPASRNTVITVAGLFTVGLMFILSGFIVLVTPNNAHRDMRITGGVFLGVGALMMVVCGVLQRKNWVRYMDQMDEDLYFLRLGSNPVWKLMKLDMLDFSNMAYLSKQKHAAATQVVAPTPGGGHPL